MRARSSGRTCQLARAGSVFAASAAAAHAAAVGPGAEASAVPSPVLAGNPGGIQATVSSRTASSSQGAVAATARTGHGVKTAPELRRIGSTEALRSTPGRTGGGLSARQRTPGGTGPGARSSSPPALDARGAAVGQQRQARRDASGGGIAPRRTGCTETPGAIRGGGGGRHRDLSTSPEPPRQHPQRHQQHFGATPPAPPPSVPTPSPEQQEISAGHFAASSDLAVSSPETLTEALAQVAAVLEQGGQLQGPTPTEVGCAEGDISGTGAGGRGYEEKGRHVPGSASPGTAAVAAQRAAAQLLAALPGLAQIPSMLADLDARVARIEQANQDASALRARTGRLEHEVAGLRAQAGRRLDALVRDRIAGRHAAEAARTEAACLRAEVADLSARLALSPSGPQ